MNFRIKSFTVSVEAALPEVCDPSFLGEGTVEVCLVYRVSLRTAWTIS